MRVDQFEEIAKQLRKTASYVEEAMNKPEVIKGALEMMKGPLGAMKLLKETNERFRKLLGYEETE